jgi:hypothetical protein
MSKVLQQFMQDKKLLELTRRRSKHQASKKGYKHKHNLSRGQLNRQKYLESKKILSDGISHIVE